MKTKTTRNAVRCAIYTRKSSEEGLEQEFNSLDAQRESGEAYVKSQQGEGWECLVARYDDGGYTGGNMERPGLQQLLADIEAGKIDCVVVYKVDRLSRSLLDFARMMEVFEKHHVAFVSVTQQFNTSTSMGRLILNVLLSFAQFEREMISERTRDKMAAARRKGKYVGGTPVLGYDIDPVAKKLVLNTDEADRVQAIFALYLEHQALLPVVAELERRRWTNKCWRTQKGLLRGGQPFTKNSLHKLLTNVTYVGQAKYKDELFAGEQPAIVSAEVWQRVQVRLHNNCRYGALIRSRSSALLKGLLFCAPCGCAMTPASSSKKGKRYRYYVCTTAQQHGWASCPSKSVPAGEIERLVVDQIRGLGSDPAVVREVTTIARRENEQRHIALAAELQSLGREQRRWHREIHQGVADTGPAATARLADLHERLRHVELRAGEVRDALANISQRGTGELDVSGALAAFDPVWEALAPHEQQRIIGLLIERVDFDGAVGKVTITYHAGGPQTLTNELTKGEAA